MIIITPINFKQNNNIRFLSKSKNKDNNHSTRNVSLGLGASAAVITGGIILHKTLKTNNLIKKMFFNKEDFNYIKNISIGLSSAIGKKIKVENLSSIMGKNELFSILPKMEKKNYISYGNLENGIFKIDLHSHSNYSDGQGNVEDLLNQAAEYGNKLHAKTGEKFIFALSDHDTIDGTKEAVKIIAQNPKKYKNIRFIPAVELSFIHKSETTGNNTECSELLVHCINPFSKNINELIDNIHSKRENMINNSLKDLSDNIKGTKFLRSEMENIYFKLPNENFAYNLHWRIYNYAQIKQRTTKIAIEQKTNPEQLYKELMNDFRINKNQKSPYNFNNLLQQKNINTSTEQIDLNINKILNKYFPKIEDGNISAYGENTFEDIINSISKEKGVSCGFAHPYFTVSKFKDQKSAFKDFINKSNGLIQTSESYHIAYPNWIKINKAEELKNIENYAKEYNLLPVGGRDNHSKNLF